MQTGVESEYIAGAGLFPNMTDTSTMIPFWERLQSGCKHGCKNMIADAGYASEENYTYLEPHSQKAYTKDISKNAIFTDWRKIFLSV